MSPQRGLPCPQGPFLHVPRVTIWSYHIPLLAISSSPTWNLKTPRGIKWVYLIIFSHSLKMRDRCGMNGPVTDEETEAQMVKPFPMVTQQIKGKGWIWALIQE